MLILHHGNRLEILADELARILAAEPGDDPLQTEVVITQSRGMARWLSLRLAERLGVAANVRFPLPGAFVWEVFEGHVDCGTAAFERDSLVWRIFQRLPGVLGRPGFEPLRAYLTDPADERRIFSLAHQIADVFDQYLVYRWAMVLDWEAGAALDDWQAELWRALVRDLSEDGAPIMHRARLLQRLNALEPDPELLPARFSLFGLSSLPPAYLAVLEWLAQACEVHLFLPNPCRQYWGDITDRRTLERWQASRPERAVYQSVGHPLLASLGKQGRDFIHLLYQGSRAFDEREHFVEPHDDSLLHRIQGDILDLRESGEAVLCSPGWPEHSMLPDPSIQFHVCHSPLREVQVLHDRLLDWFERDTTLKPGDVVVMVPAIEQYAPFVEAVFAVRDRAGPEREAMPRLPCALADRTARGEHPLLDAFLRLLELPDSRLGAAEVFELLETPAVRTRFEFDLEELETLRRWIAESGIRWGLDGASKQTWGLPVEDRHTWRFGLDRLLLGYALAPDAELYRGIAPYADVEGQQAAVLGRLIQFIDRMESFRRRLAGRYPVKDWLTLLYEVLSAFFEPGQDDEPAVQILLEAFDALGETATVAGFTDEIGLPVVVDFLQGHLNAPRYGGGFFTGRITFCSLMPMRSIPFKIVCLLGMNDADYPRRRHAPGFDLVARDPQPGDRSRREDDRYLFLEALLSAREKLYVSYVGRNDHDNGELQPSVLVRELQEVIAECLGLPFKAKGLDRIGQLKQLGLIVEHPLQPFSPRYFDGGDPRLFSYAGLWAERSRPLGPFCPAELSEPPDPALFDVDLDGLNRFFRNPAAFFLRNRLDLRFGDEMEFLEESEPFTLDHLLKHRLTEQAIERRLAQDFDDARALQILKAQGMLPQGVFGELGYRAVQDDAKDVVQRLKPLLPETFEALPQVHLDAGELRFTARLPRVGPSGLLRYRAGKLRPQDKLECWLYHLVLQLATDDQKRRYSRFVTKDGEIAYPPLMDAESARSLLRDLLAFYAQGLRGPLPFFPKTSYAYAEAVSKGKPPDAALGAAWKMWTGDAYHERPGEGQDLAVATVFRGRDPFAEELGRRFADIAVQVFGPLIEMTGKS